MTTSAPPSTPAGDGAAKKSAGGAEPRGEGAAKPAISAKGGAPGQGAASGGSGSPGRGGASGGGKSTGGKPAGGKSAGGKPAGGAAGRAPGTKAGDAGPAAGKGKPAGDGKGGASGNSDTAVVPVITNVTSPALPPGHVFATPTDTDSETDTETGAGALAKGGSQAKGGAQAEGGAGVKGAAVEGGAKGGGVAVAEAVAAPAAAVKPARSAGKGGRHRRRAGRWRTFFFILWRDIFVTGRELAPFLGQVLVEPFFILFVFGKVLGQLGYTAPGFEQVLLPGVVALNSFLVALQNTALPLAIDFSWTKEIEDRLLAPIPFALVAIEKVVFGAIRGLIGSLIMIPIGLALLDNVSWPLHTLPATLGILTLGGLVGGCVGLTLGTLAPARHISIVFAMTLTPIMFTGATQFPWQSLSDLRWFQILCAFNPLTYVSEAMRGLLLPPEGPDSIPLWICVSAIGAACLLYGFIGIKGFNKRAQD
ncbi:ABC transporter permease [Streptomyces sp. LX-29]|uniref:ABC transporter permease n=1 Tax=Streptomyces sp. LX-29 TaxID=2900152 RepID=UPI00240DE103|nr:ABC transporter permease [Streptomyces sp. LX-29]WFB09520.1 ABC transporter permease [Streptomyces sp. LX-29]